MKTEKKPKSTVVRPEEEVRTEYSLQLIVSTLNGEGIGDGETVAFVEISQELFTKILCRSSELQIAPGKLLEAMAEDAVKYDSATVVRLEEAA